MALSRLQLEAAERDRFARSHRQQQRQQGEDGDAFVSRGENKEEVDRVSGAEADTDAHTDGAEEPRVVVETREETSSVDATLPGGVVVDAALPGGVVIDAALPGGVVIDAALPEAKEEVKILREWEAAAAAAAAEAVSLAKERATKRAALKKITARPLRDDAAAVGVQVMNKELFGPSGPGLPRGAGGFDGCISNGGARSSSAFSSNGSSGSSEKIGGGAWPRVGGSGGGSLVAAAVVARSGGTSASAVGNPPNGEQ